MLDPQDEYNARRAKLMWLLSAKRVFADSDALDENYNTIADVARDQSPGCGRCDEPEPQAEFNDQG